MKIGDTVQSSDKKTMAVVSHLAPVFVDGGKRYQGFYLDNGQLVLGPILDDQKELLGAKQ